MFLYPINFFIFSLFKKGFNVIVDPKRIAFNWPVDITTVTLQDLRDSIAAIYPEIEDIAVAMPVITVAGKLEKATIKNDSDLQVKLKIMAVAGTLTFTVTLETCMYAQSTIFLVVLIKSISKFFVLPT